MTTVLRWRCGCGAEGRGETNAQAHAKVCALLGYPWMNPDYPKPGGDESPQPERALTARVEALARTWEQRAREIHAEWGLTEQAASYLSRRDELLAALKLQEAHHA